MQMQMRMRGLEEGMLDAMGVLGAYWVDGGGLGRGVIGLCGREAGNA